MLFLFPALISPTCAAHSFSASTGFAEYSARIHRLAALVGALDALKAHLAQRETWGCVAIRTKEGRAMVGFVEG